MLSKWLLCCQTIIKFTLKTQDLKFNNILYSTQFIQTRTLDARVTFFLFWDKFVFLLKFIAPLFRKIKFFGNTRNLSTFFFCLLRNEMLYCSVVSTQLLEMYLFLMLLWLLLYYCYFFAYFFFFSFVNLVLGVLGQQS